MRSNDELLLKALKVKPMTANETINSVRDDDLEQSIKRDCWKFYLQLNKRFAPLLKLKLIRLAGYKNGPTNRAEKIWHITLLGLSKLI